jgi:methyl-accepting chemotaxis protein
MTAVTGRFGILLRSTHARIPVVCSLVGAALLLATGGSAFAADVAAPGLVLAGFLAGGLLVRRHAEALPAAKLEQEAELSRLLKLCAESAQVWLRQINTVRTEGNQEVAELARVFGAICARLDGVVGAQQLGGEATRDALVAGLRSNGEELQALVAALRSVQASKQAIVQEISAHATELKNNAADIRQIALNIRIVALNATIEAARAGAAGEPFSVIVNEMRQLAARTAQASELFSRHTDQLQAMLGSAFDDATQDGALSIGAAQQSVQHAIAGSEAMLTQLTDAIAAMEGERTQVREDISRALVALQFQDRANQILSHVERSLTDMRKCMTEQRWDAVDEREWFRAMASDYSTHEEFRNHAGAAAADGQPESGITFF